MASAVKWGLMLPSRGILMGMFGPDYLLELADICERSGVFDGVWAGDSIIAKPRIEALMVLAAIAGRTRRVKLGTAALATYPVRDPITLAVQWASLDELSNGRTILCGAIGGAAASGGDAAAELKAFRVNSKDRLERTEELTELLRLLWSQDHVTYNGKHYQFEDVSLVPKPVQQPCPIWLVSNPFQSGKPHLIEQGLRRVAKYADGWMTTRLTPADFARGLEMIKGYAVEYGRDPEAIEPCVCFNIHCNPDGQAAYAQAKDFFDRYYMTNFPEKVVNLWCATGDLEYCVSRIREFVDAGCRYVVLRFPGYDWPAQMDNFIKNIAPRFA